MNQLVSRNTHPNHIFSPHLIILGYERISYTSEHSKPPQKYGSPGAVVQLLVLPRNLSKNLVTVGSLVPAAPRDGQAFRLRGRLLRRQRLSRGRVSRSQLLAVRRGGSGSFPDRYASGRYTSGVISHRSSKPD